MADEIYRGNSYKSKEEKCDKKDKKIEKVTKGTVKIKKPSNKKISKLSDIFLAEDVTSVKDYIIQDVLLPTMKKTISDIVSNGVDILLYGEVRGNRNSRTNSRVSYTRYYDDRDYDRRRRGERREESRRRRSYDYNEIILETRGEAEEVLDRLEDLIDTYDVASIADLYELVGIDDNYTDNKYGWTSIATAGIKRLRDGYLLVLPKPRPIE